MSLLKINASELKVRAEELTVGMKILLSGIVYMLRIRESCHLLNREVSFLMRSRMP